MSDSLGQFTISVSNTSDTGPWLAIGTAGPGERSFNDTRAPSPILWYKIEQTTTNGVTVPYSVTMITSLSGTLWGEFDPNDINTLILYWDVPALLPAPINSFVLSGKYQSDSEEEWTHLQTFGPSARTGTAPVVIGDDPDNNPYTYRLRGTF